MIKKGIDLVILSPSRWATLEEFVQDGSTNERRKR